MSRTYALVRIDGNKHHEKMGRPILRADSLEEMLTKLETKTMGEQMLAHSNEFGFDDFDFGGPL